MVRLFMSIAALALAGCVTPMPVSAMNKQMDDVAPDLILPKAAFELSCARENTMVPVGNSQYGVTGCGKKATWAVRCAANVFTGIYKDSCGAMKVTETQAAN